MQPGSIAEKNAPVIVVRQLRKDRQQGGNEIYRLLIPCLEIGHGEKILITGPSGSGKSTLLDMLGMALRPDAVQQFLFRPRAPLKEEIFHGHAETAFPALPEKQLPSHNIALAWENGQVESLALWRQHVGYVLQTGGLLPFLTVRDNILSQHRLLGLPGDGAPEKLAEILGITRLLGKLPSELSVGERQRAAIARALAASPPLVLADEPTAALDPANAMTVLSLFSQVVSELGSTLILVSHAPEQMEGMGFRELRVKLARMKEENATGTLAVLHDDASVTSSYPEGEVH